MDKKLKISIGVLIVLICFYVYENSKQMGYQDNYLRVFKFDHDKIHKVIILKDNDGIELEKVDSIWHINGHDSLIVKPTAIDKLFNETLTVKINALALSKHTNDLSIYSLDSIRGVNLILLDSQGETLSNVVFGISPSNYRLNFYREFDSHSVHETSRNILTYLTASPKYWGQAPKAEPPDSTSSTSSDL